MKAFLQCIVLFLLAYSCRNGNGKELTYCADKTEINTLKKNIDSLYAISDIGGYIQNERALAEIYRLSDSLAQWLYCYDRIIKICRDSISNDSAFYYYKIVIDSIWKAPLDTASMNNLAWIHRQIAYIYGPKLQQWDKCIPYYEQGIRLIDASNSWTVNKAYKFLKPCGSAYTRIGEPQNALNYLSKCYTVGKQFSDTLCILAALNDLGKAQEDVANYSAASNSYLLALQYNKSEKNPEQRTETYAGLSNLYLKQNKMDSALKYIAMTKAVLFSWDGREDDNIADFYALMADANTAQAQFDQAEINYNTCLKYYLHSKEPMSRYIAKTYISKGAMLLLKNDYDNALVAFQASFFYILPDFQDKNVEINPNVSLLTAENSLLEACEGKGDAFYGLYSAKHDISRLEFAASSYETALNVAAKLHAIFHSQSSGQELQNKITSLREKYANVSSLLSARLKK